MKIITKNKKAFFDYEILEKFLAGIVLLGCEIKSIREGNINLKGGYIIIREGEIFLKSVHISPYKFSQAEIEATRERKLLLHKREIDKITRKMNEAGITCVPLALGLDKNLAKIEIALVRGKKKHDKRESLRKKSEDRDIAQKIKKYI